MRGAVILAVLGAAVVSGCGTTNTRNSWSCRIPVGQGACANIEDIDQVGGPAAQRAQKGDGGVAGAVPVRWWEPKPRAIQTASNGPRREGEQVVRIVYAPFVDEQGDYHARSEVYAVVRRGGWWVPEQAPSEARVVAGLPAKGPGLEVGAVVAPAEAIATAQADQPVGNRLAP